MGSLPINEPGPARPDETGTTLRFHEFSLRIPGDEFRMRFHDHMTVVAGIGEPERVELLSTVLGALSGGVPGTRFEWVDDMGMTVTVETDEQGTSTVLAADGTIRPGLFDQLSVTVDRMRSEMRVDGADLGLRPGAQDLAQNPELAEAEVTLRLITDELQAGLATEQTSEALRDQLAELDERIRRADEGRARREYARVLAALERVRSEAAVLRGGSQSQSSDQLLVRDRQRVDALADTWQEAVRALIAADGAFGSREPIPEQALDEAVTFPDTAPEDLERLSDRLKEAETAHDQLADRLSRLVASNLPEPSDPVVAELARVELSALWTARDELVAKDRYYRARCLGVDPDVAPDDMEEVVTKIEQNHAELEAAREDADNAKVKLRSGRRVDEYERREAELCDTLGVPSYLSIHIRRLEQSIDGRHREHLEEAGLQRRLAEIRWRELAGDIDPQRATELEDETNAYAKEMEAIGGVSDEIDRLRRKLDEGARPALARARAEMLEACRTFGIDDTDLVVEMINHQVELGRTARLQRELEQARDDEATAADALDQALLDVGFADGDLPARLGAYQWAVQRAAEREEARANARPLTEVEVDLARLERAAAELRRPEWNNVTLAEASEPDLDVLQNKRHELADAYEAARQMVPDLARLRDRHRALVRRVDVLEGQLREKGLIEMSPTVRVQEMLMARMARVRTAFSGVALPIVLDDSLRLLGRESKFEMLELCQRLSEKVQLIYLTDDPDVAVWSRRKAASAELTLMEPSEETVAVA
ncbi:MAG TPA: hypothetical protein VGA13_07630 [Acidimicrobiales bacterium]